MYIILVYDICTDDKGVKILPKVFKTCKKYLTHIQKSIFEGEMTESQILNLKLELDKLIRKDLDSVIVFASRNQRWLKKEFWGMQEKTEFNFL